MELDARVSERLNSEFDDRLRIRWSHEEQAWHLEQRFAKGFHVSQKGQRDEESDEMVRRREGYLLIMSIQPGDRMKCKGCSKQLKVPMNQISSITCECGSKHIVGFYALDSEALFEHLRRMDPLKDHRNGTREKIAENNAKVWEAAQNRPSQLATEYVTQAMSVKEFGMDMVGYTGKEKAWNNAPISKSHAAQN